ncbi:hypothetical protein ATCC90586_010820 [Pythium insidiosum]|nr:hypothetical protein ATCC90586_010820 [Pythium insidiosum]
MQLQSVVYHLAPYELDVLRYYDECIQDGSSITNKDLPKYCQQISEFAILNANTQKTWVRKQLISYITKKVNN